MATVAATLEGSSVLQAAIHEPIWGRWHADLVADTAEALEGAVELSIGSVDWQGSVYRGGVYGGKWEGRIVGGAGGISDTLDAKAYRATPLQLVLDETMSATGEALSGDATSLQAQTVAHWQRIRGPASHVLLDIADHMEWQWRHLRDGTIWLGVDDWPDLEGYDFTTVDEQPIHGIQVLAPTEDPLARPGLTLGDLGHLTHVVTELTESTLRQTVWHVTTS